MILGSLHPSLKGLLQSFPVPFPSLLITYFYVAVFSLVFFKSFWCLGTCFWPFFATFVLWFCISLWRVSSWSHLVKIHINELDDSINQ